MNKPIVTATDRLTNVLDVVELGRRSGMLRVERGQGTMREEGEIYFANGSPIYAALAGLRGRDALLSLARWSECYFTFETDAPQPIPNVSGVLPAVSAPAGYMPAAAPQHYPPQGYGPPSGSFYGGNPGGPLPGRAPSGSFGPGFGVSGANGYAAQQTPPGGFPTGTNWGGFGSGAQQYGGGQQYDPNAAIPFQGSGAQTYQQPGYPQQPNPFFGTPADPASMRRPRRTPDMRDLITVISTYNLTRSHRNMLVLADGDHTVADLSQLSGKPAQEVQELLQELEGLSLIVWV
jgi:hypothetical protein